MMKHVFAAVLCTMLLGGSGMLMPARCAESCTPLKTSTASGSFVGEICVDSETQLVRIEGALIISGRTYRLDATGAMTLEKLDGNPIYTISGSETIVYPSASTIGNINVNASGNSLTNATTIFASKVINVTPP